MIMSDDVVYRNLKVYKTLVARLLKKSGLKKKIYVHTYSKESSLVTQPILQHRPNRIELRWMDSSIQIKQKVIPPSLLSIEKSPFTPSKEDFPHPYGGDKRIH